MFILLIKQLWNEPPGLPIGRERWIAAKFDGMLPKEMFLGDGSKLGSGEFTNHRLRPGQTYKVFVRAFADGNVSSFGLVVFMTESVNCIF